VIFNVVGVLSLACYCWFTFLSRQTVPEFCLDAALAGFFILLTLVPRFGWICALFALASLAGILVQARKTKSLGWEWLVV